MIIYLSIYHLVIEHRGFHIKNISHCISSIYDKSEISDIIIYLRPFICHEVA